MRKTTFLFVALFFLASIGFSQSEASYTVTFTSNWSQATHPHSSGSLPNGAHWSKLVGAVHNSDITFLEMGGTASQGVENIAETGNNTIFFADVETAIADGFAMATIDGDDLGTSLGQIIIEDITVTQEYPLITLLSMIAPSPDWIVAINNVSLLDGDNQWIDELEIDLYPYDAGTDSGIDYTSPNNDTFPQEPISSLQGVTPFSNEIIGTFNITLDGVVLGLNDSVLNQVEIFPNPAVSTLNVSADEPLSAIRIYNALGSAVLSMENLNRTSVQVDVQNLPSGFYFAELQTADGGEKVRRFVKR